MWSVLAELARHVCRAAHPPPQAKPRLPRERVEEAASGVCTGVWWVCVCAAGAEMLLGGTTVVCVCVLGRVLVCTYYLLGCVRVCVYVWQGVGLSQGAWLLSQDGVCHILYVRLRLHA